MIEAYVPEDPLLPALLVLLAVPAGFLLTRLRSAAAAWLLVIGGTVAMERLTAGEPAGFRMLMLITFPLFALKAVVVVASGARLPFGRYLLFAAGWFGMRPELFAGTRKPDLAGARRLAARGTVRLLAGALLIVLAWRIGDPAASVVPLMAGLSLVLHFGILNLQAAACRAAGFPCDALFRAPLLSSSLSEFWGRRWNRAFSEMTATAVYRPLTPWFGARAALVVAFLFSGLLHELAISVPVGKGFGLPLLYFALHGAAMEIERVRGIRGRAWTIGWVVLPLPLLFHPPFVREIVLPLIGL